MTASDDTRLPVLIAQCKRKDERAQRELFAIAYPAAMGVCRRYAPSRDEAHSILNEGFLKVFTHLDQYDDGLHFLAWVKKIMVHTAIDHYRRQKRYALKHPEIPDHWNEPFEESILDQLSTDELLDMIGQLSPAYRMVFSLYAVEGYTHKEIAEKLGITEGTSKSNLAKAKQKLQQAIQNRRRKEVKP
ncbi:MAG: RNA polymerase sigma factor [Nitritalea sp.]